MYYTISVSVRLWVETALKNQHIQFDIRNDSWKEGKWGTHKFDKRNESKIINYLSAQNKHIVIRGHSIYEKQTYPQEN